MFRCFEVTNFVQRNHHEVALVHQRMRYFEIGLVDGQGVVQQDVDVDRTVLVLAGGERFMSSAQSALYLLCDSQYLIW